MNIDADKIRQADKTAFAELFRQYSSTLFRIAYSYVHNEDSAYDLVQQTFEKAIKNAHTFRGDSAPKSWLVAILINSAKNMIRANKNTLNEDAMPQNIEFAPTVALPPEAPESFLLNTEKQQAVADAFNSLPSQQKEIVRLRIENGFSFKEIAEILNISDGNARVNYHHAVKNLKKFIKQQSDVAEQIPQEKYKEV